MVQAFSDVNGRSSDLVYSLFNPLNKYPTKGIWCHADPYLDLWIVGMSLYNNTERTREWMCQRSFDLKTASLNLSHVLILISLYITIWSVDYAIQFVCSLDPQFVGSFNVDDRVFFFFRETAVDVPPNAFNVYSRVAKVCKVTHIYIHISHLFIHRMYVACIF